MDLAQWLWAGAAAQGRAIREGRLHAVELTEAYLAAIAAHPDGARIYARTTPRRARAAAMAAAARAKAGQSLGPLDGVPLSWKDLFDAAGALCEGGSAHLAGRIPEKDAEVLARAAAQGAVCLGKTHMTELAFSGLGLNPVTATPPNRNFPGAVPGGSSSGAAASLAFGLAAGAIGSDTGGSIRVPAAWNDLVGFKPSHGTLPMEGVLPLAPKFDTLGPLARNVEDAAALWALLRADGPAPDLEKAGVTGLRLAVLESVALDDLRPEPAAGFDDALARLARAGAQVSRLSFPAMAEALALAPVIVPPEAYGTWREVIEAAPEKMFPPVLERFRGGAGVLAMDYVKAWQRLKVLRAEYNTATAGFDAVLLPTSAILPPDAQRLLQDPAYFTTENLLALRNTRLGNLMNQAVLTLPTGQPSCGVSFMVAPGGEARLLRLGAGAEAALR
jgi:aspartyl-tRNA(Asn)/glutamyl-tRNA(Gln) amidotransferase subunit A